MPQSQQLSLWMLLGSLGDMFKSSSILPAITVHAITRSCQNISNSDSSLDPLVSHCSHLAAASFQRMPKISKDKSSEF